MQENVERQVPFCKDLPLFRHSISVLICANLRIRTSLVGGMGFLDCVDSFGRLAPAQATE